MKLLRMGPGHYLTEHTLITSFKRSSGRKPCWFVTRLDTSEHIASWLVSFKAAKKAAEGFEKRWV